ncbi:hypothetical protein, partial [Homoserinimonas sp. OAct 916]|uniref:hypothetical protein n=1 Tax=Homoserinimonas sp. OAct 916 TaxID=2211450 RepID=UPI001E5012B3
MLFGTAAALVVTMGTPLIAARLSGVPTSASGYVGAAAVYAMVGTALLLALAFGARGARAEDTALAAVPMLLCLRLLFG